MPFTIRPYRRFPVCFPVTYHADKDKIVAVSGGGQSEIALSVGETVVSTKGHGLSALAITTARLLGFSSTLHPTYRQIMIYLYAVE